MVIRRKKKKEFQPKFLRCDDCDKKIPENEAEITEDGVFCAECYDAYLMAKMQPLIARKK